jgi:hypothetical protein
MTVHIEAGGRSEPVLVEFHGEIDSASWEECIDAFNRIPHIWWKDVIVILRELSSIDPYGIELLLYLRERASTCDLWLVHCRSQVVHSLDAVKRCFHLVNVVGTDLAPDPAGTAPWHSGRQPTSSGHKRGGS